MTLNQETRWAYSTMLRSPHGATTFIKGLEQQQGTDRNVSFVLKTAWPCSPVPWRTNRWLKSPCSCMTWTSKISLPRYSDRLQNNIRHQQPHSKGVNNKIYIAHWLQKTSKALGVLVGREVEMFDLLVTKVRQRQRFVVETERKSQKTGKDKPDDIMILFLKQFDGSVLAVTHWCRSS